MRSRGGHGEAATLRRWGSRFPVHLGTLDGSVRCVSVLIHVSPADLPALEQAVEAARAKNARLLVIIAPLLPRWWRTG